MWEGSEVRGEPGLSMEQGGAGREGKTRDELRGAQPDLEGLVDHGEDWTETWGRMAALGGGRYMKRLNP